MNYNADDFANDETWLEARYAAALERVGGDKANPIDPIVAFMIGATWGRGHTEQHPRPLTPDDITDEMVERAAKSRPGSREWSHSIMRLILEAALTEPPARPEGAEEWETWLSRLDYLHDETGASRADLATLANDLATGVVGTPKELS